MHFRILKMIATSVILTALACTKFIFSQASALDPLWGLTALPRPSSWFNGTLLLREKHKGRRQEGTGRKEVGEEREEEGRGKGGRKGREERKVETPLHLFWHTPLSDVPIVKHHI